MEQSDALAMTVDHLAQALFQIASREELDEAFSGLDWDDLPEEHQDIYLKMARCAIKERADGTV